jgi:hypothetical protein
VTENALTNEQKLLSEYSFKCGTCLSYPCWKRPYFLSCRLRILEPIRQLEGNLICFGKFAEPRARRGHCNHSKSTSLPFPPLHPCVRNQTTTTMDATGMINNFRQLRALSRFTASLMSSVSVIQAPERLLLLSC